VRRGAPVRGGGTLLSAAFDRNMSGPEVVENRSASSAKQVGSGVGKGRVEEVPLGDTLGGKDPDHRCLYGIRVSSKVGYRGERGGRAMCSSWREGRPKKIQPTGGGKRLTSVLFITGRTRIPILGRQKRTHNHQKGGGIKIFEDPLQNRTRTENCPIVAPRSRPAQGETCTRGVETGSTMSLKNGKKRGCGRRARLQREKGETDGGEVI